MTSDILVTFLFLMVGIFFIPKLLQRLGIPAPITEFMLGVLVIFFLPQYVTDTMLQIVSIFGVIGIITIFLFAGMEVDFSFIKSNKMQIFLGVAAQVLLIWLTALLIYQYGLAQGFLVAGIGPVNALLLALVLVTPSAGFIISTMQSDSAIASHHKAHHSTRAISAEIVAIFLLILFLELERPDNLVLIFLVLGAVVAILPWFLRLLYQRVLRKIVNVEFSFFFVIALISAMITHWMGLHYLVGAFVAGLVINRFTRHLVEDDHVSETHSDRVLHSMNFFATLFIPFFFFSVGLAFKREFLQWQLILVAFFIALVVSVIRLIVVSVTQTARSRKFMNEIRMATALLPTLLFTFVIADLLFQAGRISGSIFAILIWYGIFTSLSPIVTKNVLHGVVIPFQKKIR